MNPNKTVKRIEKIEKEICGVFDLVLIFGCSGCEFIFKIYGFNFWLIFKISGFSFWFGFMFKNSRFTFFFLEIIDRNFINVKE